MGGVISVKGPDKVRTVHTPLLSRCFVCVWFVVSHSGLKMFSTAVDHLYSRGRIKNKKQTQRLVSWTVSLSVKHESVQD